jgi:RimJ/RimL family protein N-acetyltransferase
MTDPILRDFPYTFDSERLTIRGPLPGDGVQVHTAVTETREQLLPWLPWVVNVPSPTEYEVMMRKKQLDYLARKDFQLLLFLRGTQTLVGFSGVHRVDWSVPKGEIGYWVRKGYERQGYITEAVQAITALCLEQLGFARMEIRCDTRNKASAAVARRCGYELEATLHFDGRHHLDNGRRDTHIFYKLSENSD